MKKKFLEQLSKYMPYVLLAGLALLFVITSNVFGELPLCLPVSTLTKLQVWHMMPGVYQAVCVDRYFKSYPLLLTNFSAEAVRVHCVFTRLLYCSSVWFSQLFVPCHKHFLFTADRGLWYADPPQALSRQTLSCNRRGYLMTILPFFILSARLGMDCHPILGTSTVFIYCFLCALQSENIVIMYWPASPEGLFYTPIPSLISYCHLFLF